jgi:hypothetical protein
MDVKVILFDSTTMPVVLSPPAPTAPPSAAVVSPKTSTGSEQNAAPTSKEVTIAMIEDRDENGEIRTLAVAQPAFSEVQTRRSNFFAFLCFARAFIFVIACDVAKVDDSCSQLAPGQRLVIFIPLVDAENDIFDWTFDPSTMDETVLSQASGQREGADEQEEGRERERGAQSQPESGREEQHPSCIPI